MSENKREVLFVECTCKSPEHLLAFITYYDTKKKEEDREVYLATFLNFHFRWYKRLWLGLKYIFGYKCRYGHFDETVIDKASAEKIIQFLKKIT